MASVIQYCTDSALRDFSAMIFERLGLSRAHAAVVGDCLVQANLRGLDSHGVARIPIYAKRLRLGLVNPRPTLACTRVAPSAAHLDGDDGMGMVVGTKAMDAGDRPGAGGRDRPGWRPSEHPLRDGRVLRPPGRRGRPHRLRLHQLLARHGALRRDCKPILGVNPLAVGVPAGRRPAVVLDMAMSEIARGKMRLAAMHGEPIADGLGVDKEGKPTRDGMAVFGGGAVHPFGGPKGSALAIWMEIMGGVSTGAAFAGEMKSLYEDFSGPQGIGHVFMAIRPDLFMPLEEFKARMDTMIERFKDSQPGEGVDEVLMPGEPEARREAERHADRRAPHRRGARISPRRVGIPGCVPAGTLPDPPRRRRLNRDPRRSCLTRLDTVSCDLSDAPRPPGIRAPSLRSPHSQVHSSLRRNVMAEARVFRFDEIPRWTGRGISAKPGQQGGRLSGPHERNYHVSARCGVRPTPQLRRVRDADRGGWCGGDSGKRFASTSTRHCAGRGGASVPQHR